MDPQLLELLVQLVTSLSDAIVGIVYDDLTAFLLEEIERLLLEPGLDLQSQSFSLGRLCSCSEQVER